MKNTILLFALALCTVTAVAQKRAPLSADQLRDSLVAINAQYDERRAEIVEMGESAVDSVLLAALETQLQAVEANCSAQMFNFCLRELPTSPEAMQYIYMLRLNVEKEAVAHAVSLIKGKARNLPYAQAIKRYVEGAQVVTDGPFMDFLVTAADSSQVKMSDLVKTKNVLLIFGDPSTVNLPFLQRLYDQQGNSTTEIISFTTAMNMDELTEMQKEVPWMVVSDFEGHLSKVRCDYNAEILPTTVYVPKSGLVSMWAIGVPDLVMTLFVQE